MTRLIIALGQTEWQTLVAEGVSQTQARHLRQHGDMLQGLSLCEADTCGEFPRSGWRAARRRPPGITDGIMSAMRASIGFLRVTLFLFVIGRAVL